jgi:N-acetylglutamate synthase-like GNAT family acetyltransferase
MIKIVPFIEQYHAGVIEVILPIQQKEFAIPITLDKQKELLDIAGYYQQKYGNFWVALSESEVVGTISLLDIGNHQGALRKMFVKSEFRGQKEGVAQALLNTLLEWCQTKKFKEIYLGTTEKFLAAHRFYKKNNFIEISKSELPSAFPIMAVDVKFYKYVISRI